MLTGKKILVGITGSIAAYKIPILVRLLVKAGAEVKVIMTPAARDFVSTVTLSTLSRNPVLSGLSQNDSWSNHVMLGRWADIMLIAPLSCNTLAKMATGICDNLLMAVYLSATCKVIVAPAMDEDMWLHPTTVSNLNSVKSFGNEVLPVDSGELASGLVGEGRMAEPEFILKTITAKLSETKALTGRKAMITAGPTYEQIDPVRFIGNYSSGKMGIAIAKQLQNAGAEVTLVLGPGPIDPSGRFKTIRVKTAAEMYDACVTLFPGMDITVMSAAVADYTPSNKSPEKIKKSGDILVVELMKTKDILLQLGKMKKEGQLVVGFALETNNESEYARQKLRDKNADIIILNSLRDEGAGFGTDTNKISIFDKWGREFHFEKKSKDEVAKDIVQNIIEFPNERS